METKKLKQLKFEDCKHRLEATELENKVSQLEKNKLDVYSLRENHKRYIKNNRSNKWNK